MAEARTAQVIARALIKREQAGATAEELACDIVAEFEGFSASCYLCPAGVPTVGFGRTRRDDGRPVTMSDPPCTREEATGWLLADLASSFAAVDALVRVPLRAGQRAALASFVFNLGRTRLQQSTLLRVLNSGRHDMAANELLRWNMAAGKVLPGLVRRRNAERYLFLGRIDA